MPKKPQCECHFEKYCLKICKKLIGTSRIIILKCAKNLMSLRELATVDSYCNHNANIVLWNGHQMDTGEKKTESI